MIWILGPCSAENEELYIETGRRLATIMKGRDWYYKASFDKANRTHATSRRGPGFEKSLKLFEKIKRFIPNIKLTTDFHVPHQASTLKAYIDLIQVPAFLSRQTDMLIEAGKHFPIVNVKKGQWMDPWSAVQIVKKVRTENRKVKVWLTERGTFFGYGRLTVDFSAVPVYVKHFDEVILDCTHPTMYSSPTRDSGSYGDRELAERYLLAAGIFGYTGVFAETHPTPADALSDAASQIPLDRIPLLVKTWDNVGAQLP